MVLSSAGVVLNYRTTDTSKSKEYNNFKFTQLENGYMTVINNKQFFFSHYPETLEEYNSNYNLNLNTEKIYFTYDPNDTLKFESNINKLGSIIFNLNIRPVKACISEESCPDIPVVNCSEETPKFLFKESNLTKISQDMSCIILESDSNTNMDKLVEIIYYKLLGVMN